MTPATAAALSIAHGVNSNLENGSFNRAYPRSIFVDNKFLRNKPKLFGRQLISRRQYQQLSITNDSTPPDLIIKEQSVSKIENGIGIASIHHVGLLCENLEKSLEFYQGLLGLPINNARPNDKLPYRGAWLWVGSEMIHLMELPNPDPLTGRPEHGGRDRHACIAIKDVNHLKSIFDNAGITYTLSRSGRPAIFTRDPDGNALEFTQVE